LFFLLYKEREREREREREIQVSLRHNGSILAHGDYFVFFGGFCQAIELPQKESNRKGEMPQNKNPTQTSLSERGFGKRNGVNNAGKKSLAREISKRYQKAGKKEKTGILNERIQFTRTRAYHKNDNCCAGQKNYSRARAFVGYDRFPAAAELDALAALYRPLCPLINFFIPSEKLISKTRGGSKIRKVYDKQVLSPYRRLLACPGVSDELKARLVKRSGLYSPAALQQEVRDAVDVLASLKCGSDLEEPFTLAALVLHASNYG